MKPKNKPENRSYNFEVRANEDTGHTLEGRAIVYDSETDLGPFSETIAKGALDRTNLKDVRFLVNHDTSKIPLARSRNNNENSTMQLSVDDDGLKIRVDLDVENNTEAASLYSAVKRGDISGMSFMFSVDDDEWEDIESDHPKRTIKEISSIYEVSAVTFPAYEETSLNVRDKLEAEKTLESVRQKSLESEKRALENALELEKMKIQILYGGKRK